MPSKARPRPVLTPKIHALRSDVVVPPVLGCETADRLASNSFQRAVDLVATGTKWLDSKAVDAIARKAKKTPITDQSHPDQLAQKWASAGRIFGILHDGSLLFPAYAFKANGKPVPALKAVLTVLSGMSAFSIAAWFESTSSTLGGMRPRELLARDGEAVLAAARAFREGPLHG